MKPWVQNRVNCINEVETVWKHVPGSVNPADIATREINLLNTWIKDEWFNGPQFLCSSESEWPCQEPSIPQLSQLEMKTETLQLVTKIEYKDDITTLIDMEKYSSLFVDDNGILRCQSCLCQTENLSFNYCNPIYIPHEEQFVKLVILKAHNHVCHSGVKSTLNQLRTKYWIIKGRQKVKTICENLCGLSFK